jgi:ribonuclease HI
MADTLKQVTIYTDGGCDPNPGPGGYGIVLLYNGQRKELSGGFRRSTNNRMELYAAIRALEALKEPCAVTLYSDSQYLVNAISKGWAANWKRRGWMRNSKEPALNPDLWERLLTLCAQHTISFVWLRGHAGNSGNERCDQLVALARSKGDLPEDTGYKT